MTNAAYQAVLAELEKLLPPRAVSHMLKQGLAALGRTPATLTASDIEPLLRGPLHAYLRQQLHGERATAAVANILERLNDPSKRLLEQTPAWTEKMRQETEELTAKLSHYNLYFDWPEVQELRSRVNEARTQLLGGEDVRERLDDARVQLGQVQERLAAELAEQTRRITELTAAAGGHAAGDDRRARRLRTLVRQLLAGMEQEVLMPAELARAERLLAELDEEEAGRQPGNTPAERLGRLGEQLASLGTGRSEKMAELRSLLARLESGDASGQAAELGRAEELLKEVLAEAEAKRSIAGGLSSPGSLDRLLDSLGPGGRDRE